MNPQVRDVQEKAKPVLEQYGAVYAGVFGSVARGEATKNSDVDMLVQLGSPMGLVRYIQFTDALKKALAREVDVISPDMHPLLRKRVQKDLVSIYG